MGGRYEWDEDEVRALLLRGPQVEKDVERVAHFVHNTLVCEYWRRYKGLTQPTDLREYRAWVASVRGSPESGAAMQFVRDRGHEMGNAWLLGSLPMWIEQNKVDAFAAMTDARRSAHSGGADGPK